MKAVFWYLFLSKNMDNFELMQIEQVKMDLIVLFAPYVSFGGTQNPDFSFDLKD